MIHAIALILVALLTLSMLGNVALVIALGRVGTYLRQVQDQEQNGGRNVRAN